MSTLSSCAPRAKLFEPINIELVIGEPLPRIFTLMPAPLTCVRCQASQLDDDALIAIAAHCDDDELFEAAVRELSWRLSVPGTQTSRDLVASPFDPAET